MQIYYLGMIFYFVIKFPKGIFDIHISLVRMEINFLLTSVMSFKISPVHLFVERLFVLQIFMMKILSFIMPTYLYTHSTKVNVISIV